MRVNLWAVLMLVSGMCAARPAHAQRTALGDVTLRVGVTRSTGLWVSAEAEVGLSPQFAVTIFAKDIEDGMECLNTGRTSPCTGDGRALGLALRLRSVGVGSRGWWPFLEGEVGVHRYRQGGVYPLVGASSGIGWFLGPRGTFEAAIEVLRISAALVDPLDFTTVIGGTHRTLGGLTLRVGVRVG